jgi:hypothetical protein
MSIHRRNDADNGRVEDMIGDVDPFCKQFRDKVCCIVEQFIHLVDRTAKVEQLEDFICIQDSYLQIETFLQFVHELMRERLIKVVCHHGVRDVTSHYIEDRTLYLWWDRTTSADGVEVKDSIEGCLDAELPHWPGVEAGELANIGEGLVDVTERHLEVLKVVWGEGDKKGDSTL